MVLDYYVTQFHNEMQKFPSAMLETISRKLEFKQD